MLFTGLGQSILGETVPWVSVPPSVYGLGWYSRPRAQFLPIQTSQPVNNIIIYIYIFWVEYCGFPEAFLQISYISLVLRIVLLVKNVSVKILYLRNIILIS